MTIASTTNRNDYTGDGATSTYSYSFKIFVNTSLVVTVADADGAETTLTLTTDYTVTGVGETAGGTIVLVNSSQAWLTAGKLTTGYTITIRRIRAITQNTDIRNQGDYFPEVVEDEFDKQIIIDQQQQDELDRSVKIAVTDTGVSTTLPTASADKFIGWDSAGTSLTNKLPSSISEPVISGGDTLKLVQVNSGESAYQLSLLKTILEAVTSGGFTFNTAVTMESIFKFKKGADVASAGTMTLGDDGNFFDITGTTGITSITIKTAGTVIHLQFDGILTITDGSNLKLSGDFTSAAESTLTLVSDGTNWFELARSPIDTTVISDVDGDTKIQVEETADEDIIRFDTAGSERMVIDNNGLVGINGTPVGTREGLQVAGPITVNNATDKEMINPTVFSITGTVGTQIVRGSGANKIISSINFGGLAIVRGQRTDISSQSLFHDLLLLTYNGATTIIASHNVSLPATRTYTWTSGSNIWLALDGSSETYTIDTIGLLGDEGA